MLASFVLAFSCSEDQPTQDPSGRQLVSRIDYEYSAYAIDNDEEWTENYVEFSYNSSGLLTSASRVARYTYFDEDRREDEEVESITNYSISTSAETLTLRVDYSYKELVSGNMESSTGFYEYELNEDGFVARDEDGYEYDYNRDGQLERISSPESYDDYLLDWVGDNLVGWNRDGYYGEEYVYSRYENLCNMDLGVYSPVVLGYGLTGESELPTIEGNKSLLAMFGYFGVVNYDILDDNRGSSNYYYREYEFTSDDLIETIERYENDRLWCTLTFSYK